MIDLKKDSEIRKNLYEFLWLFQETSSFSQLLGRSRSRFEFWTCLCTEKIFEGPPTDFLQVVVVFFRGEFGRNLCLFSGQECSAITNKNSTEKKLPRKKRWHFLLFVPIIMEKYIQVQPVSAPPNRSWVWLCLSSHRDLQGESWRISQGEAGISWDFWLNISWEVSLNPW